MRAIQRSQRDALAVFSEDSNCRRAAWQEYLRRLREARQRQTVRQQQREAVSSSLVEIMQPAPEIEHLGVIRV
ncbi:MAG: hypothetical protein VW625_03650 [Perlucidibaca sp.]